MIPFSMASFGDFTRHVIEPNLINECWIISLNCVRNQMVGIKLAFHKLHSRDGNVAVGHQAPSQVAAALARA
jgi:hypothetical protein